MLPKDVLTNLANFDSVKILNEISKLKARFMEQLKSANELNDTSMLNDKKLKLRYTKLYRSYSQMLSSINEKETYEDFSEALEYLLIRLNRFCEEESYTLKKTNKDFKGTETPNPFYIYKIINWRENEKARKVEVVRTRGGVVSMNVQRPSTSSTQSSLYVGPMDLQYYSFYAPKYFVVNTVVLVNLLKLEKAIRKRISLEIEYLNKKYVWAENKIEEYSIDKQEEAKNHYLTKYKTKYHKFWAVDFKSMVESLSEMLALSKEKHRLIYHYFMTIYYFKQIMQSKMELIQNFESTDNYVSNHFWETCEERFGDEVNRIPKYSNELIIELYEKYRSIFHKEWLEINKELKKLQSETNIRI